jgi:RNA polymerase sigma factor (sigma-70 family)
LYSHSNHSDQDLLTAYQKSGQSSAFTELFSRYQSLVLGTCIKYLKDRDEAQDATMSIFEKLIEKLKTEEVQHFKSWLYMVTKNHCLMELRKKGKEIPSDLMEIPLPVHHTDDKEELENDLNALEECIETLKVDQQTCVRLFYLKQNSYQQVSEQTSFDLKAVKSFIQNGKRNLKQCLESKNVSR